MSEKRKYSKAFQVGPENLPDGLRKRKAQRIKQALIDRAKLKQDFAKSQRKRQDLEDGEDHVERTYDPYAAVEQEESGTQDDEKHDERLEKPTSTTTRPHPDRQALMERDDARGGEKSGNREKPDLRSNRRRVERKNPFSKESAQAQRQREEAEQRQREREEADKQRQQAWKERSNMQRLYNKANLRGADGKKRLGRESELMLAKVKRMMASGN